MKIPLKMPKGAVLDSGVLARYPAVPRVHSCLSVGATVPDNDNVLGRCAFIATSIHRGGLLLIVVDEQARYPTLLQCT